MQYSSTPGPFKGYVFDFDGTLVANIPEHFRTMQRIFRSCGLPVPSFHEIRRNLLPPFYTFYKQRGVPLSEVEVFELYEKLIDREAGRFYSDALEIIPMLAARGVKMGIVSASPHAPLAHHCERAGVAHHFPFIVGRAQEKSEHIKRFCIEYDLDPTEVCFIGDFPSDMSCAIRAGVVPIAIKRAHTQVDLMEKAGAVACLATLRELVGWEKRKRIRKTPAPISVVEYAHI